MKALHPRPKGKISISVDLPRNSYHQKLGQSTKLGAFCNIQIRQICIIL